MCMWNNDDDDEDDETICSAFNQKMFRVNLNYPIGLLLLVVYMCISVGGG